MAIVNFLNFSYQIRVSDLSNFVRKMMEKNNWNTSLGMELIGAYDSVRKLKPQELSYLYFYLAYPEKGVILLCRTSNPGGSDLQFLDIGGKKLYEHVAELVATQWNTTGQCALVVGATFPSEIARVREIVGDLPLLVPGIGAQGGDVEATLNAGRTAAGTGLIINNSRAILYAGKDEDFAQASRQAAQASRDLINPTANLIS